MAKEITLSVRVTPEDRDSIDAAVDRAAVRLTMEGVTVSRGSYLLGLHRAQEEREKLHKVVRTFVDVTPHLAAPTAKTDCAGHGLGDHGETRQPPKPKRAKGAP